MASDFKKPDRTHTLFTREIPQKLWPLPAGELFFVGRASAKKLYDLGIYTIGELAKTDVEILKRHMKKQGELIWNFANGRDFPWWRLYRRRIRDMEILQPFLWM